jgi:uncharacterized protein (DUF2235 family)
VFYDEGVGTEEGETFRGGMFGAGLLKNLSDGYRFLIFNHTPGDEIYVFGFSRGAYTARSFVGLLGTCGILTRRSAGRANDAVQLYKRREDTDAFRDEVMVFRSDCSPDMCVSDEEDAWRATNVPGYQLGSGTRLKVRYLGVWDTVGALGIPAYIAFAHDFNRQYQFHDVSLSPIVEHARHAVSIDEAKKDFAPTLWDNLDALLAAKGTKAGADDAPYQQVWFPGVHGSVGGGGERRGLSDQALDWIWDGARNAGLELDTSPGSRIYELSPSHREYLENNPQQPGFNPIGFVLDHLPTAARKPGPKALHEVSVSARRRWHENPALLHPEGTSYRPPTLEGVAGDLDAIDPATLGVGPEPDIGEFQVYVVERGDSLRAIAKKFYGHADRADWLLAANRSKITDADRIYVGQVLRIPKEMPETTSTARG